jgi:hypothetical protein
MFLIEILELHSGIVEWTSQGNIVNLAAELIKKYTKESEMLDPEIISETTVSLHTRFLSIIMKIISILRVVYTEAKNLMEIVTSKDKKKLPDIEKEDAKVRRNSSPSFTRKIRNSLPFGERKIEPAIKESLEEKTEMNDEVLTLNFHQQLNAAYQSSKIKTESGSILSTFLSDVLKACRSLFKCIPFSLSSKFAEEIVDHFNVLFNVTNGNIPSEIVSTVTYLLRALFQINDMS